MTPPPELVTAAAEARCPNEHTAHKNDGPLKRTWVTCGDEELASRIWDTSSGYDLSDEIRWFFKSTLDEHHRATWPALAVAAVLRALRESEAVVRAVEVGLVRGTGDANWDGTSCPILNDSDALAIDALAALAREFGDPT